MNINQIVRVFAIACLLINMALLQAAEIPPQKIIIDFKDNQQIVFRMELTPQEFKDLHQASGAIQDISINTAINTIKIPLPIYNVDPITFKEMLPIIALDQTAIATALEQASPETLTNLILIADFLDIGTLKTASLSEKKIDTLASYLMQHPQTFSKLTTPTENTMCHGILKYLKGTLGKGIQLSGSGIERYIWRTRLNSKKEVETSSSGQRIWSKNRKHSAFLPKNENKTVHIVKEPEGILVRTLEESAPIIRLVWSPDNTHIAVQSIKRKLDIWNTAIGKIEKYRWEKNPHYDVRRGKAYLNDFAWNFDGSHIAYSYYYEGDERGIVIYNRAKESYKKIKTDSIARRITWSPDGKSIAYTDYDGAVLSVLDIDTGKLKYKSHMALGVIEFLKLSPYGEYLYAITRSQDNYRMFFLSFSVIKSLEDTLPLSTALITEWVLKDSYANAEWLLKHRYSNIDINVFKMLPDNFINTLSMVLPLPIKEKLKRLPLPGEEIEKKSKADKTSEMIMTGKEYFDVQKELYSPIEKQKNKNKQFLFEQNKL